MEKGKPLKLMVLFKAFSNPNRVKIYKMCLKKSYNITQLTQKLGLNYKTCFENIKVLEDAKLIKKTLSSRVGTSRESLISSIPMDKDYIGTKLLKELEKEQK